MRVGRWAFGWMLLLSLGVGHLVAQTAAGLGTGGAETPTTVDVALHRMSDQAAVVFVGTVTAVRWVGADPASAAAGVVEIDFAVDQALRGCDGSGTYTLREWAGMWAGMSERYRLGQRLFLMLHAPSASGMSSPVGGSDGAIPVRGGGATVGERETTEGVGRQVADLRWVGAKLGRPVVYRKEALRGPAVGRAMATQVYTGGETASARLTGGAGLVGAESAAAAAVVETAAEASVPAQEASLAALVSLMSTWTRGTDASTR